jgi:hypothetical protein
LVLPKLVKPQGSLLAVIGLALICRALICRALICRALEWLGPIRLVPGSA